MFGLDIYSIRARLAPATLVAAPALALGIAGLPMLPGAQKLWGLVAIGLVTFASLIARRAGSRVEPELFEAWGGKPTTARLRYRGAGSAQEVRRRHEQIATVLGGWPLPREADEAANPGEADAEYDAAMKRVIARLRSDPSLRLLNVENRNYGFARNLYGLKQLGQGLALLVLVISTLISITLVAERGWTSIIPLLLPIAVSLVALILWRQVDSDFVQPSATAYADRVVDGIDHLAGR